MQGKKAYLKTDLQFIQLMLAVNTQVLELFCNSYLHLQADGYTARGGQGEQRSHENGRLGASCPCRILTPGGKYRKVFSIGQLGIWVTYSVWEFLLCGTISINYSNYIPFNVFVDVFPLLTSLSPNDTCIFTIYILPNYPL